MKIDVLTLAPAFLPVVPAAYRGIAAAVLDEIKSTREANERRDQRLTELTAAYNELARAVRSVATASQSLQGAAIASAIGRAH